jgi:hypothetical protein
VRPHCALATVLCGAGQELDRHAQYFVLLSSININQCALGLIAHYVCFVEKSNKGNIHQILIYFNLETVL